MSFGRPRFLPVRDDALLIELDDLEQTIALFDSLSRESIPGVGELVPGARTVLVHYRASAITPRQIVASVLSRELEQRSARGGAVVEIPVHYEGEDLDEVATVLGVTPDDVVRLHTGSDYSVAFTGFAPGFAYLSGGHAALDVPRRPTPRARIPTGSVALAGTFSGVYPRESPGGWQLIGSTDSPMWDLGRERPALLQPGDLVRFVDVTGTARPIAIVGGPAQAARVADGALALEVLSPGMLTLLQDLGRPGLASMGVSASGALDPVSLRAANRLVGNDPGVACLEVAHGGLRLRAHGDLVIAVTGAPAPVDVTRAGGRARTAGFGLPFAVASGDTVSVGTTTAGIRSYLSVRGGFDIEPVLGSCSTDVLAGLGPAPITAGDVLQVRPIDGGSPAVALHPLPDFVRDGDEVVLDLVLGPRTDWFSADAVAELAGQTWTVSARSNRVGLRLAGTALSRVVTDELPSEGTVSGAVQIPPDGQPVLFLADHPLTGGYPVIGSVATHHLPLAGQLPAGARIRFNPLGEFAEYSEGSQ